MSESRDRAELLAALHAAGAASESDELELENLLREDAELETMVRDFEESISALASSFDPMEPSPDSLKSIKAEISRERKRGGFLARIRAVGSKR